MLKRLDEDHYGLEKVKERIIEFLAVQKKKLINLRVLYLFSWPSWSWKKLSVNQLLRQLKKIYK